ncbi:MAG: YkgJ family cysteine cluster protein [Deltaproteobacteria bacterium]|nr:YkgJ family cysteine cluster protein [Deltaproteobacteria bacterium]
MTENGGAVAGGAFVCRRCGQCCQGRGGVWLGQGQILEAASLIGVGPGLLKTRYLWPEGRLWGVKSGQDGFCLFYDPRDKACLIHQAKPLACGAWPFYWTLFKNEGAFAEAQGTCPALAGWDYQSFLSAFGDLGRPMPPKSLKKALDGFSG